jgi:ribonuclease G
MRDFIVTEAAFSEQNFLCAALYEERKLTALKVQPCGAESLVGQIRTGYVSDRVKNIGGAFVTSGKEKFFLPDYHPEKVNSGHVVFSVTKDAFGNKNPVGSVTPEIPGRYAVVRTGTGEVRYSKKLTAEEKRVLQKWLEGTSYAGMNLLVRTNARRADKAAFLKEVNEIAGTLEYVLKTAEKAGNGAILYKPAPFYADMLKDLYELPDRILTDSPSVYDSLRGADGDERVSFYENRTLTLAELYGLPHELEKLTGRVAWLKCGAYLVIEKTEAFVSIDVNSGKCEKGRIPEETYRKINLEAAEEVVRQVMLRNLSGMILVDFINLSRAEHREELVNVMKKLVKKDHLHMDVIDLTPLGIMEIVRQKGEKSLEEILKNHFT